ncbi:MAG: hypothetical protein WD894_11575 [Pirellulales bacterium]
MISNQQREMLTVLSEIWGLSPDVRLGQLFAHLGFLGESHIAKGLGYIEDDELLAVMYRHRSELTARLDGTQLPALPPAGGATSASGSSTLPEAARG